MPLARTSPEGPVVHGLIQTARGYLGDGDYVAVEAMLSEAVEAAKDLEAECDRFRRALEEQRVPKGGGMKPVEIRKARIGWWVDDAWCPTENIRRHRIRKLGGYERCRECGQLMHERSDIPRRWAFAVPHCETCDRDHPFAASHV